MSNYWSKACAAQYNRPLQQLLLASYASCTFVVSMLRCCSRATHRIGNCLRRVLCAMRVIQVFFTQVVSFCVAALYSGKWYLYWARAGVEERMWGQLGLFSGMFCVGSVAGALAWIATMQSNSFYYEYSITGISRRQQYALYASGFRWYAAFLVFYSVEFLCLVVCKLLLLGRLVDNAAQSSQLDVTGMSGVRRRWLNGRALPNVYRVMAGSVVVGGVVGMVANAASAAYYAQYSAVNDQAAAACDASDNDTNSSLALFSASSILQSRAYTALTVQASSEALTLLLVSVAFVVIVSWSVALIGIAKRIAERALISSTNRTNLLQPSELMMKVVSSTVQAAAEQRRRLIAACVIVLITFPARAAFDLLNSFSTFQDLQNPACGICDPCQSEQWLVRHWIDYTPEFQSVVVAVSSPLPLTLSLWLMTKAHARAQLIAADVQRVRLVDGV